MTILSLTFGASAQTADAPAPVQNPRIALVIGEATYPDQTLATPANDAGLVAQVLQAAGFDVVGARDLDEKSIRVALRDFLVKANAAGPNMQAFVYLAGRAVQYEGDNYFVPIDAQIARDSDVPIESVRLADFTHALTAAPGVARIVVVDGARATPYAATGAPLAGGLALVDPDVGTLLAFNASPGSIAGDEAGPYGVYAKTLAGAMRTGGAPVDEVFAQTRVTVNQATAGAQIPWSASKLTAPYFIFERAADSAPAEPQTAFAAASRRPIKSFPVEQAYGAAVQRDTLAGYEDYLAAYPDSAQARRVRAILAARREALFWRHAYEQNTPRAYWTYLRRYPNGPHAADADRRLSILSAELQPPPDFAAEDFVDLPPPPPDELVYADRPFFAFDGPDFGPPPPPPPYGFYAEDDDWRDLPPPQEPTVIGVLPALAVAIPLFLTARAYHDGGRHDGHADRGAPPPTPQAFLPPPLPAGVHPVRPAPSANPNPPIPGGKGGKPPAVAPAAVAPVATPPVVAKPLPLAPAAPAPTPTPTPAGVAGKPLKPAPVVPGAPAPLPSGSAGKLPPPTPAVVPAVAPTPTPVGAKKPLAVVPTPLPSAGAAKLPPAPVVVAPVPPKVAPAVKVAPAAPTPVRTLAPLKPPAPAVVAPPAPLPQKLSPPKAPAPVVHASPPPVAHVAPPPVVHVAPPPVVRAPPPVVRAAPPPQVVRAPPPAPARAAPERPKCGAKPLPACPK